MTLRSFVLLISLMFFWFAGVSLVVGQIKPTRPKRAKIWFVARVVEVKPFTIEYLDDWNHYQEGSKRMEYQFVTYVTPQGVGERVERFKLGDLISGESCYEIVGDDCPRRAVPIIYSYSPYEGVRFPPPVAMNLKKLARGNRNKWSRKGMLVEYKPREVGLVNRISIYRDGRIDLHSYSSAGTRGKLSDAELKALEQDFFSTRTDASKSEDPTVFDSSLVTIFGRLRFLKLDPHSDVGRSFTNRIDRLAERLLDNAQYRVTYRWRFKVKEWEYGDMLPIDEAARPGYEFILANRDRLSKIKVPENFYEEAKERQGEVEKSFYRFKGKLYRFTFATCTDRSTGSWGCYRASETGKMDSTGKVVAPFDRWPASLGVSLRGIPDDALTSSDKLFGDGIPIPEDDFIRHRRFYSQILGSRGQFQEGDFVYWDVTVWFK